jgi:predicted enzyme related to lactoylglutathione lyase
MERVTGIGGFLFKARDPERLQAWYATHLGVDPVPQSPGDEPWRQEAGPTAFAAMPEDADMFGGADRSWAINFRVADLDAMVAQLRGAGVEVEVDPENYPIGRFATLKDPEGNVVQLWQPDPSRE